MNNSEQFVDQLINRMSLGEKTGQMTQITHSAVLKNPDLREDGSPGDSFDLDPDKVARMIKKFHVGSFLNGIAVSPEEWCEYSRKIQEVNLNIDRHGIPLIYGIDHMHGASYVDGSTIFPHSINLGCNL